MYKIIGTDGQQYGPVSADQIRHWIAENRLNARSQIQVEGSTEWKELSAFPEFAAALASRPAQPPPPAAFAASGASTLPPDILSRDYDLDIGGCISGGWDLLKNNFGVLFGGVAIYFLIVLGCSLFAQIPIIGLLGTAASIVITGPLMGGVYYLFVQAIRRQPVSVGDVFAGFRKSFVQLFLGYIVIALLAAACFLPAGVVAGITLIPAIVSHQEPSAGQVGLAVGACLVCLIPVIYLSISWIFSLPLIIDKGLTFWPAMEISRKMVGKHWWTMLGFLIVCGLINLVGVLACCIGVLFTCPIVFGAMMYAYERIFSSSTAQGT